MTSFKTTQLINPLIRAISEAGYSKPTEIQAKAIPVILSGKDILAMAPVGSGTASAFVLPLLQLLKKNAPEHRKIRSLIVAPNFQAVSKVERIFKHCDKYSSVSVQAIHEHNRNKNSTVLRERADVLIISADMLPMTNQGALVELSKVEILIFYKTNELLSITAKDKLKNLFRLIPQNTQKLFFGNDAQEDIRKLSVNFQKMPVEINVEVEVGKLEDIIQSVCFVETRDKTELLFSLYNEITIGSFVIFTDTKYGANKLLKDLKTNGISSAVILSDVPRSERSSILEDFEKRLIKVLITTDIASRDFKINGNYNVVHYELPVISQSYVSRIEKMQKRGKSGNSYLFCTADEHDGLKKIEKLIGYSIDK
ncbi:DEAD/DEAH box helicase [Chryseobacterium sp. 2R14A]|uniref:DEAD/DEAH box helicase n=1 Tax=Chryseobacterium sp. 2R14A TaxID=3380353 RepID=UPI003CF84210